MKTIYVADLPECDLCHTRKAKYDCPTTHGSWGYLCARCFRTYGRPVGSILKKKASSHAKNVTYEVRMKYVHDTFYVTCPSCRVSTEVEPDADSAWCQNCSAHLTFPPLI